MKTGTVSLEVGIATTCTRAIPAIPANCPEGVPGFKCGDLKNVLNVNAPGITDSERDTWMLNAAFDLTDSLSLKYSYGKSDVIQKTSRDQDNTNVVAPEEGDFVGGHNGVDSRIHTVFPYDESTHELQLFSDSDGPFNLIAGLFYTERHAGPRGWKLANAESDLETSPGIPVRRPAAHSKYTRHLQVFPFAPSGF